MKIIYYVNLLEIVNVIQVFVPIIVAIIAYFGITKQLENNRKDRYANIMTKKKLEVLDNLREETIIFLKNFITQSNIIHSKLFYKKYSDKDEFEKVNLKFQKKIKNEYYSRGANLKCSSSTIALYNIIIKEEVISNKRENYDDLEELLEKMIKHVSYKNVSNYDMYLYEISNKVEFTNKTYLDILKQEDKKSEIAKKIYEDRTKMLSKSLEKEIGALCASLWEKSNKDTF